MLWRRSRQRELRLRDFNRTRAGRQPRSLIRDTIIDMMRTRAFRRVCLTMLVMFCLVITKHQRVIDDGIQAGHSVQRLALAHAHAKGAAIPQGLTDFQREAGLGQWRLLHRWDGRVAAASKRFHVRESWIRAVMIQESGGRTMMAEGKKIVSNKGAMGLMQIMPDTYAELRKLHGLGDDPFDPDNNIAAGAAYLSWLHARYGFGDMFAAYNAGPGTLESARLNGTPLPLETQNYVTRIAAHLRRPDLMNPAPAPAPDRPMLMSSLERAWDTLRAWVSKGTA